MPQAHSLPAELTIYTVGELHPQWLAWLADASNPDGCSPECCVDAAAVDLVDAAGLQLLASLSNGLARQQRTLRLLNPSPPLAKACATLGLSALLATPESTEAVS
ncbi:MAG: STAS domain-containing protein [Burkholderiaceae bacterium]|nr:STAS domain-containing protein [Burkholderiaceae bacterium]